MKVAKPLQQNWSEVIFKLTIDAQSKVNTVTLFFNPDN